MNGRSLLIVRGMKYLFSLLSFIAFAYEEKLCTDTIP